MEIIIQLVLLAFGFLMLVKEQTGLWKERQELRKNSGFHSL